MRKQSVIGKLPTPAGQIIGEFIDLVEGIRPITIAGVYLTGSIALNDFRLGKSDIDFLVFCKELPDIRTVNLLDQIHKKIAKKFPAPILNGCYLTTECLQHDDPASLPVIRYQKGKLDYTGFEMAAITLSELKSAITIMGPPAEELSFKISSDYINRFLYHNINGYWHDWIRSHSSFSKSRPLLILFPRLTEWSVLGAARQLYTLQTGKIISKKEAGKYCLTHLPANFHPIVREAIRIREDKRVYPFIGPFIIQPSLNRAAQTIRFVKYVLQHFNDIYEIHKGEVVSTHTEQSYADQKEE